MLKLKIVPFNKISEYIFHYCKLWQLSWGVRGNNVPDSYYLEELAIFILALRIYDMLNFRLYQGYLPWISELTMEKKKLSFLSRVFLMV